MTKPKFTDLPPRQRGRESFFVSYMHDLKLKPGHWAEVRQYENPVSAASMANNLRKRFGPEGYEFASRQATAGDHSVVYARFVDSKRSK